MTWETFSLLLSLTLGTFISEDASCVSGGLLAAQGRLSLAAAISACGLGIFVSDLAIIFAGRAAAVGARGKWLRWISPSDAKLAAARRWFIQHGGWVVLASRFIPGTRSATCFAAGVLRVPMSKFAFVFFLASAVWTPLAVGAVYYTGVRFAWIQRFSQGKLLLVAALFFVVVGLFTNLAKSLASWRGRRLLLGKWRRLTLWEYWPIWVLYSPVVVYLFALAARYRSLMLFTGVNPGIGAGGGLLGESKSEILRGLSGANDAIARWRLVDSGPTEKRHQLVQTFMAENGLSFPLVLKPDAGQRGQGVVIARNTTDIQRALVEEPLPLIAQAYVPGIEFGVFYYRLPSAPHGQILAITDKRMTHVVGDGVHTLEELILQDERAVCMADFFLRQFSARLREIPRAGENVSLSELGTHCRGALFLDGTHLLTPALLGAVEKVSRTFEGFYFGRYDVRTSSIEALQAGEFTVIELNGITSEATSMYDPKHSVWVGWGMLFRQWRIAYEIAAENRARGGRLLTIREIFELLRGRREPVTTSAKVYASSGSANLLDATTP